MSAAATSQTAADAGERDATPPARADTAAWLAVAAGSLGALMAALDISIVNSALPTIQGEIGASGTEGTWISTAYLVAEIVIIPLSGWLGRLLGLRTFLLIAVILFTAFSVMCGLSSNLTMMIIGRAGQGFTGGALIPTAMTIIATRLPPAQQPIGTAMFGLTGVMGPVLGPLVGGWLTENFSWHYIFFLNLPIGMVLVILLVVGLPHQKARLRDFREADWLGIAGLALGLGAMTVVLEEGQREQWFESSYIIKLTLLSLFGFGLLIAGQYLSAKPVIRLRLLLDRQFGSVAFMAVVLGMVIYGTAYAIPQFLANIADYNALQSGYVVLLTGVPTMLCLPFLPLALKHMDVRFAVGMGMAIMALSCVIDTDLTSQSVGGAFTTSQLMRGVGQIFVFMFLNQAAISSVAPEDAGDASGLFNAARNIGGSFALAAISTLQDQRSWLHARRIEETLNVNSVSVQDYVASIGHVLGDPSAAYQAIEGTIQLDALVMSFNDLFWLLAIFIAVATPLVLFLKPLPKGMSAAMH